MPFKDFRTESRTQWGANLPGDQKLTTESIKLGCMLRIADATEVMAKRYNELIADLDLYKRWYKDEKARAEKLEKQIQSYKGVITKKDKLITKLQDPMTKQPKDARTDTAAGADSETA